MEDAGGLPRETLEVTSERTKDEGRKSHTTVKWTHNLEESEPMSSSRHVSQRKGGGILSTRFSFGRRKLHRLSADSSRWSDVWANPPVGVDDSTTRSQRRMLLMAAIAGLIAVFSIALIVRVVFFKMTPSLKQQLNDCYTADCTEATVYMKTLVNNSIDPCTDFYGHVCWKWEHEHQGQAFLKDAASTFLRNLHDKIQYRGISRYNLQETTTILISLYVSCSKFLSHTRPFYEVITTAVKLFELPRLMRSTTLVEIIQHAIYMSLARGVSTTFRLRLEKSGDKSYLRVQPEMSLSERLRSSDGLRVLGEYFEAVLSIIAPNTTGAEVAVLDEDVGSIRSSPVTLKWISLEELGNVMHFVSAEVWRDAINAELPREKRMDSSDAVLVVRYSELKRVMEVLAAEPVSLVAAYMSLHSIFDVLTLDHVARYGRLRPLRAIRLCLSRTKKALPFRWALLIHVLMPELVASADIVDGIYDDVKRSFVEQGIPPWMDATTRRKALMRLNATTLRTYRDCVSAVDTDGTSMPTPRNDFLEDYTALLRFSYTNLLRDPPNHELREMEDALLRERLSYIERAESIFVPPVLQRRPVLYHSKVAPHFNYATLGALIALEMSRIIGPKGATKKSTANGEDLWSGLTRWNFVSISKCYSRQYRRAMYQRREAYDLSPDLEDGIFTWAYAARVALAGLKRRQGYPSTDLGSDLQTFFSRFCLLSCSVQLGSTTSRRYQCVVPVMNLKLFASAFECSTGTLMNPGERCS